MQQIGMGVRDVHESFRWVRKAFGMDIPVFDDVGDPVYMTKYTGGVIQRRHAILATSLSGGCGFEIWQYLSREPEGPAFEVTLGDLGIFAAKIKAADVTEAHEAITGRGLPTMGGVFQDPAGRDHFFLQDPSHNIYQVVADTHRFQRGKWPTGGTCGGMIGVSDIDEAKSLYSDALGFDTVVYDEKGTFEDLSMLPGGKRKLRRMLLVPSESPKGLFSKLVGPGRIELVQSLSHTPKKIFGNRYWGDLGFIHLCFDVNDMVHLKKVCEEKGFPFTVDSGAPITMGSASGRFSYVEDSDGTLIEFVETSKFPIQTGVLGKKSVFSAKLNLFLNLANRKDPTKPLPGFLIKLLSLSRVKDRD
jgi:catechol 2,3-dioxygenase-like lactoylglutathione lyase family enzyme